MKKSKVYLAIDLGASSGRVMAGSFSGRRLDLAEVHRFPNGGTLLPDGWHWDILGLFAEVKKGLAKAAATYGSALVSAGVDAWGVDYGLVDKRGRLLGLPFMYRDARTDGLPAKVFRRVPRHRIYGVTGIQTMSFNTLFQVYAERDTASCALDVAHRLLFVPDLFHFWLSGRMANEYTIASTSQLLDGRRRIWSRDLMRDIGIPGHIFGEIVPPGTEMGELRDVFKKEIGLPKLRIVAPGSHDTASAIAAVPAAGTSHAYLSSGTWSLMGIEVDKPLISSASAAADFTNEGGVCGKIRLLRNICGLWLVQESRRMWSRGGAKVEFEDLRRVALASPPMRTLINPDHADFAAPGDIPARIAAFCLRTGQKAPRNRGETMRCIYESIALRYAEVFGYLEEIAGRGLGCVHVVGGGSQDGVLSQFAADALQRPLIAGPVEATAIGNILVQMMSSGDLRSLDEGRALVRDSFPVRVFSPRDGAPWDAARERFAAIRGIP